MSIEGRITKEVLKVLAASVKHARSFFLRIMSKEKKRKKMLWDVCSKKEKIE